MEEFWNLFAKKVKENPTSYIGFLEELIRQKDGESFLDWLQQEYYMRQRDRDIIKNLSPSPKSESA